MLIIGITGGIGSGKSYVANRMQELGAAVIDTDQIAHQLTAPHGLAMPTIEAQFGSEFIDANGAMDRIKMRHLVFQQPKAKTLLESILHPLIRSEVQRQSLEITEQGSAPYLLLVIPLLIESGNWKSRVERVLVVDCPVELQIERVMSRNGMTREEICAIIDKQVSRSERLLHADDILDNSGTLESLENNILMIHQKYLQISYTNIEKT